MNIGKIFLKFTFVPSVLARFVRTKASTSVIGMMASVRVSLTMVAKSPAPSLKA